MDSYFEKKKRDGLIFTYHNLNPEAPYTSIAPGGLVSAQPVTNEGPSYWSRELRRYRTYEEQQEYLRDLVATNNAIMAEWHSKEKIIRDTYIERHMKVRKVLFPAEKGENLIAKQEEPEEKSEPIQRVHRSVFDGLYGHAF